MPTFGEFRRERLPQPLTYYKGQGLRLSGSGNWRSARCPFHRDRDPSLSIHVPSGGFNCHGCGATGGDVLDFHRKRYRSSFQEAAQDLGAWEELVPSGTPVKSSSVQRRPETHKDAARGFATRCLGKDFVAEALHTYRDERGVPIYWKIRAKDPNTGKKWMRPMHWTGTDFVLRQPEFERGRKPLYNLGQIAARSGELVLVCEGEKCADKLHKLGFLATTSGSANSANGADWTPLAERRVIFWPDHDEPGQRYANDVIQWLTESGCKTEVIDTAQLGLGEGEDVVDWLKLHPEATKEAILGLPKRGTSNTESFAIRPSIGSSSQVHTDSDIIAHWCVERCIFNCRAWTGITSLYRDLCDWCGPDYAFAPGEFVTLLKELEIRVHEEFAERLALMSDFESLKSSFA